MTPPDDGGFEPEIVVLHCEQSTATDVGRKPATLKTKGYKARFVMLPCSSKVEAGHVLKILEEGADGVEVVGCPEDKCRFLSGSNAAEKRIRRAAKLLEEAGMSALRVGMTRGFGLSAEQVTEIASKRAEAVKSLGPNPLKGGNAK